MLTPKERGLVEMLRTQAETMASAAHSVLQTVDMLLRIEADRREPEAMPEAPAKKPRATFGQPNPPPPSAGDAALRPTGPSSGA